MRKLWKRVSGFLLTLAILLSVIPPAVFAANPEAHTEGTSYFDFDAADYSVREDDKALTVKITRHGDGAAPANVAVKVADFLSVYGENYEVRIDKKPLSEQEGTAINPSDFTDKIFAVAGKQRIVSRARTSDADNKVSNSMIQVTHTPFSRARTWRQRFRR